MPRPSNREQRRAEIARGLMRVMAHKGYDGSSVAEVASAAGVTPGLVHYHFKNKEEILLAVLEVLREQNDARLEEKLRGDPDGQIGTYIDHHLASGKEADPDSLFCWIVVSGEAMRRQAVRAAYEEAVAAEVARLRAIIEDGNRGGTFSCGDPGAAASALVAAIQGFFVLAATARSQIPRGSAARSARSMARGLLGALS